MSGIEPDRDCTSEGRTSREASSPCHGCIPRERSPLGHGSPRPARGTRAVLPFRLAPSCSIALMLAGIGVCPAGAQTIRGQVVDASNGRPVAMAGVYLVSRERTPLATTMADSAGWYVLDMPGTGEYVLMAERFGYLQVESPLVSVSAGGSYGMDFELQPEPLGLSPMTVTVRNEELVAWLTLEMGMNPASVFGFRVLQGPRLQEAKLKGRNDPTETLRWLYIPVWHGGSCVSLNATPSARTVRFRGPRQSQAPTPGEAPSGTRAPDDAEDTLEGPACGSLFLNDRRVPNEHIQEVDMSRIAVVVTLPTSVRMYTYDFSWSFRNRHVP